MTIDAAELSIPPEAVWGPTFDVGRATDAYIATVPAADRVKSDAYFEGGYWIELWSTLITVAVCALLLRFRFAARVRDFAAARGAGPFVQALAVAAGFIAVLSLLTLPWALYTAYFREHQYGMSNYTAGGFLGEWVIGIAIARVSSISRSPGSTCWSAACASAGSGGQPASPPCSSCSCSWSSRCSSRRCSTTTSPCRRAKCAIPSSRSRKEAEVPVDDVFWFDASKQTKRISANVSGLGGTARIALNDNLLHGTSPPEIRAVMGHELGHYRLHHGLWLGAGFTIALAIGYLVINRQFGRLQRRYGERFGIRDLADPAGLPLAFAIFTVVMYLISPVTKSMVRTAENHADAFGLDVANEPHGFASVAMRLSTYRKLEPGSLEEVIFFDHPSGRARVERSMRWLADHPPSQ